MTHDLKIPVKSNRILNLILIALLLIVLRIWHLAVIQYDKKLEESRKPQQRAILEPAKRATIRDRFNQPLAINKIQYNAAIIYASLRQIPSFAWKKNEHGQKIKSFRRKEYIAQLAQFLGQELDLDPERVEDLIHAKASLYHNLPFVIKEDITESEYYRLKILEKDWPGIYLQRLPKRHYPLGKVGCDIIGYMGAINRQEYESILEEIQTLEIFLRECDEGVSPELPCGILTLDQAEQRLKDLQEHAYSINDYVGKSGIEGRFEQDLRGYHGKKVYYSDARGNFLKEMPGSREPLSGQRLLLTISSELQEYAEILLAQNERIREAKVSNVDVATQALLALQQPWIKGGSIIAMDPKTGEILAMASYPRFEPNDFIVSGNPEINKQKNLNIRHWFEGENYIGEIWDQKCPLEKELYDDKSKVFFIEKKWLSWNDYLYFILPKENPVRNQISVKDKIHHALDLQRMVKILLDLSGQENLYVLFNILYKEEGHIPYKTTESAKNAEEQIKAHAKQAGIIKKQLDFFLAEIPENYDKVLYVDLYRLAVNADLFHPEFEKKISQETLSSYREVSAAKGIIVDTVKHMAKNLFHETDFKNWRKMHEKEFLKEKRALEKNEKRYAKPYIDYLDAKENELFQSFWNTHGWQFVISFIKGKQPQEEESVKAYLGLFYHWHKEIQEGSHADLSWRKAYDLLKQALIRYDSETALNYLKTMRGFQELTRPLMGRYRHIRKKDNIQLERHLAAAFYPTRGFGYGRSQAYRQSAPQGSIFKLITAYAALVQRYRELEDKEKTITKLNPLEMIDHTHRRGKDLYVGYQANGNSVPRFYKGGRLPKSPHAMGQLDLLKAIEKSSNPYFSLLAGDILKSPEDLATAARLFSYGSRTGIDLPAEIPGKVPTDLSTNRTGLYATAIGQHSLVVTPAQAAVMLSAIANGGHILKPKIVNLAIGKRSEERENQLFNYPPIFQSEVFMPAIIRKILLEGMRRVVVRTQADSLSALSKFYKDYPEAISDYIDMKDDLVGKTSTAEVMENINLDLHYGTNMYKHVWFGGISFKEDGINKNFLFRDKFGQPELVVVIYLRFGNLGKESAPLAAQIVQKWREIKKRYERK